MCVQGSWTGQADAKHGGLSGVPNAKLTTPPGGSSVQSVSDTRSSAYLEADAGLSVIG